MLQWLKMLFEHIVWKWIFQKSWFFRDFSPNMSEFYSETLQQVLNIFLCFFVKIKLAIHIFYNRNCFTPWLVFDPIFSCETSSKTVKVKISKICMVLIVKKVGQKIIEDGKNVLIYKIIIMNPQLKIFTNSLKSICFARMRNFFGKKIWHVAFKPKRFEMNRSHIWIKSLRDGQVFFCW